MNLRCNLNNICFAYCCKLDCNPEIAKLVNEEEVTKAETMTVGEIFDYINKGFTKFFLSASSKGIWRPC